mgnify:FL=1
MAERITKEEFAPGNKGRGGKQPGAGRPPGVHNKLSVNKILKALEKVDSDKPYEIILVEDFVAARNGDDPMLVFKYHQLILNKLVSNMNKIEVLDSSEVLKAKQTAFMEALAKFTNPEGD